MFLREKNEDMKEFTKEEETSWDWCKKHNDAMELMVKQ